jgi:signal transduction histidine kinase
VRRFIDSSLAAVYRRWQTASLTSKIVLPSTALVVLSLIGAAILLSEGSNVLRRRFLEQQVDDDAETVATLLEERLEALAAASELLAADPEISQGLLGDTEPVENGLRSRATAVLARFELSLVHVYDRAGRRRVALIRPGICLDVTTSSSIPNLAESDKTVARAVDDRLLLLSERDVLGGAGTVVVGTDLETELERIRHREGLATEIGLSLRGTRVGTDMELAADDQRTSGGPHVHEERLVLLGATPAQLLLTRRNDDARQVTRYAAIAVVSSTIVTAVSLSAEIASDLPIVRADKRRLRQVMLNLLSNAATFTESGRINVRARQVEMYNAEVDRVEPFVEVCIGETGAIGPGDVPGTTPGPGRAPTLKGAAAGLGLPITETLVDLHGGRIWTGNNRGEGMVFTFVLPVTQPEPAQNSGAEKR